MATAIQRRELTPVELMHVGLAATLFDYLGDPRIPERAGAELDHAFLELDLPLADIPEFVDRPLVVFMMLAEICPRTRAGLARLFRHAPILLELASCEGYAIWDGDRFQRAAWLFLNPGLAKQLAVRFMPKLPFPGRMNEEFLNAMILREKLYSKAQPAAASDRLSEHAA